LDGKEIKHYMTKEIDHVMRSKLERKCLPPTRPSTSSTDSMTLIGNDSLRKGCKISDIDVSKLGCQIEILESPDIQIKEEQDKSGKSTPFS